MDTSLQFRPEDRLQKTWIPEGTEEYKIFKLITLENRYLGKLLRDRYQLGNGDLVLDVGGRKGDIALELQKPEYIHIIDPDPTLILDFTPAQFWNERIQDVELEDKYKLIICSHVLGYLGTQNVQDEVFEQLTDALAPGGTLVLFFNRNTRYVGDLLEFSKEIGEDGHYDYFDESLIEALNKTQFDVSHEDVTFDLNYETFEDLSRCCWFLYGARDQDIEKVAKMFLPRLKQDLNRPEIEIDERALLVTRK
jgi:SAM-dependent methyltransferase